jgi:hypothetical protein
MRNRLFASLFVVIALVFGVTNSASANQWDYIYGEDPTNANNVSVNLDVKIDPLGGVYIIGYFFGQFEGHQSGSDFARFVQHRSANGTVDWTIKYMSEPSSTVPARTFAASVDGTGTLFINSKPSYLATRWFSIDREGHLVEKLSPADFSCPVGVAAQDGGVIGICVGTPVMLRKVDKNFQLIWEKPVEQFIDTTTPSIYFREDQPGDIDEQIIQGANASVWVIDGLNYGNFAQTQNNLPLSLRSALAMTSFDATTGEKLVAIKHYGLLPLKAISIGEREVWMSVKTLDTSACYLGDCSEEHLNAIFDSSNGAMKGYTSGNFGLFPRFARFTLVSEGYKYLFDNGFTATNLGIGNGSYQPDWCIVRPFSWTSRSWVGAQNEGFDGFNSGACSTQATWSTFITNDGRRLIMAVNNQLAVWEITGTNLPTIGRLISRQTFASKIQAVDADNLGNIYVVGSTFETRVIQSNELRQPAANIQTQSLSANRAFITRNPMGRISLDVLPRTPLRIKVAGTNGVPSTGVGAVSMNVTVTSPDGEGFITVYPCDSKPDASNLNYTLDQTVPNAVIAPVSSTGDVCFYTYAKTHLIADVNGYFPTGSGFVSNTPARVIDTRVGSAQGLRTVSKTKVGNGTELRVQLTNLPGGITPATGVGAVSLNVTVTGSRAPSEGGFVTVYPCGNRPDASNLNFESGQTVPNAVITPVSSNGEVCFYVYGSADLIADINGYFPGGAGFVATEPVRVADTRSGSAQGLRTVTKQRIGGNTTLQLQLTNLPGGITPSSGIGAVSLNVTAVNTTADKFGGYVTTYPCGSIPDVSSLNFVSNQIVPNAVIAPLSANGTICFFAYGQTDLIVDLNGYFPTGAGFTPMSPVRLFDTR